MNTLRTKLTALAAQWHHDADTVTGDEGAAQGATWAIHTCANELEQLLRDNPDTSGTSGVTPDDYRGTPGAHLFAVVLAFVCIFALLIYVATHKE